MKCGKETCRVELDFRIDCFLIPLDFNDAHSEELEHWICPVCGWESVE